MSSIDDIIRKAKEDKEARKGKPPRIVPTTPEALYGDLVKEEEAAKSDIADPFGYIEEELGRRIPGEAEERLKEVEQKKEQRYIETTGTQKERERLKQIETEMDQFGEGQVGFGQTASEITEELRDLKAEKAGLEQRIKEKGVLDLPSGERIKIPEPGMAADALSMTIARTASEMGRGFLSFFGDEAENMIPKVKSENDVVNFASEAIPLVVGGMGGAKLATKLLSNAPKVAKFVGFQLGAPLGEAFFATEETSTLREMLQDDKAQDALTNKMQVLMEGMVINTGLEAAIKAVRGIGEISQVNRLLRAIPVAFMSGEAQVRKAVGERLADMIADAENATTPEARKAALEKIQANIAETFEAQTGIKFDDYLEGRAELPEGAFEPTFGGTADSRVIAGVERGLAQQPEAKARVVGRQEAQERAVQQQVATTPEARAAAEEQATQAREQIGEGLEQTIEEARVAGPETFDRTVQRTMDEVTERVTPVEGETALGLEGAQESYLASRAAAADATDVIRTSFLNTNSAKNQNYESYIDAIKGIEIPAGTTRQSLAQITDSLGIVNPGALLVDSNPMYRKALNALTEQQRKLDGAIEKRLADMELSSLEDAGDEAADIVLQAMRDINYKDVKLTDVEGLLRSVRQSRKATNPANTAEIQALKEIEDTLDGLIVDNVDEATLALRDEADAFFQTFADVYRQSTGSGVFSKFRFGDKINDQMLADARTNVARLLDNAGTDESSITLLRNIRNNLEGDELAKFDNAVEDYFVADIFSRLRTDVSQAAISDDPIKVATNLAKQLKNLAQDRRYAYLLEFSPNVRAKVEGLANSLEQSKGSAEGAKAALEEAQKRFDEFKKAVEDTPEAKFAEVPRETNSIYMIQQLMKDPNAEYKFKRIWDSLDDAGKQKLRAGMAQGILDGIYTGTAKIKETGELSLAGIDKFIESNPVFKLAFPDGDPSREMFDVLVAQSKAIQKRTVRATSTESATADISDVGQFVSELINYIQGPLSKQGRRSKMLSRVFFNLAGGPEKAARMLSDAFMDPRIANQLLEEAKTRAMQTAENLSEAKTAVYGRYLLGRMGITGLDEFNKQVKSVEVMEQTDEALQ